MTDFIELKGASGARYRFRNWEAAGRTPMAGNFVVIDAAAGLGRLAMAGVIDDLSKAPDAVEAAGGPGEAVFVRLNISRQRRTFEHEDLVAEHRPALVLAG
ncbi:hypothetical protein LJR164_004465 [Phenylobacterium sp. LjRoot164]|uniref:hypothetical protein n=1 Tax=unclassified Phenylobacterium TaxID=2640670 RepID=UPI003ED0C002